MPSRSHHGPPLTAHGESQTRLRDKMGAAGVRQKREKNNKAPGPKLLWGREGVRRVKNRGKIFAVYYCRHIPFQALVRLVTDETRPRYSHLLHTHAVTVQPCSWAGLALYVNSPSECCLSQVNHMLSRLGRARMVGMIGYAKAFCFSSTDNHPPWLSPMQSSKQTSKGGGGRRGGKAKGGVAVIVSFPYPATWPGAPVVVLFVLFLFCGM